MQKAMFYENKDESDVKCHLCPHGCYLKPGQTGLCLARRNVDGELYSMNYGKITSLALDPIEKKPLRMFYPGSYILSAGSFGCNLKCSFCQNWQISQREAEYREATPRQLADMAIRLKEEGNIGIAYTYNEPSIWYEFVHDCAVLTKEAEMKNVLVTNGYIGKEPMQSLLPNIDAMNIDLKSFADEFYSQNCKGRLDKVKQTIELCAGACHVEVTTLLIQGKNDDEAEIERLASWLASVSPEIPLHLTRYHPDYKMSEPKQMSPIRLAKLAGIAKRKLKYVFFGNI